MLPRVLVSGTTPVSAERAKVHGLTGPRALAPIPGHRTRNRRRVPPPAILQRGESYAAQLAAQRRIYLHLALLPIFVHGAKAVSAQQAGKSIGLALFSADPGVPVGWPQR